MVLIPASKGLLHRWTSGIFSTTHAISTLVMGCNYCAGFKF